MATLREYFDTDFPSVLNAASTLTLTINQGGSATAFEVRGRVHYDFDSGTKYVSYFIPTGPEAYSLCEGVAMNPQWLFDSVKGVAVRAGYPGERTHDAADLKFSGRVFLYTEDLFSAEQVGKLEQRTKEQGLDVVFRTPTSALERSRYEKPLAFISHDWRDKKDIAQPIALGLSRMRCPVWYDEYSVKVGDRKSTRLNSSHGYISYAVFCLKKKKNISAISFT